MTAPKLAYSTREAADACGVGPQTIRDAIRTGALTARYPGTGRGKAVIEAAELQRWLADAPSHAERP